ncbi:MAG: tautomerase family protein [Pseudomonadota bacterium]
MPLIHARIVSGRDQEKIEKLALTLSEAAARVLEIPEERVHVVIEETNPDRWSVGGVMKSSPS